MDDTKIKQIVDWLDVDLIKPWHLLMTGADGTKTYGIIVRRREPKEDIEDLGYCREYPINDYTLNQYSIIMKKDIKE